MAYTNNQPAASKPSCPTHWIIQTKDDTVFTGARTRDLWVWKPFTLPTASYRHIYPLLHAKTERYHELSKNFPVYAKGGITKTFRVCLRKRIPVYIKRGIANSFRF